MAEFIGGNEKDISVGEPIVFENKTESKYEVCAGIVFHKSGIYEVSVAGNRTIVSEVPKRKTGKWIHEIISSYTEKTYCSECGKSAPFVYVSDDYYGVHAHGEVRKTDFCPHCGADMRKGESND